MRLYYLRRWHKSPFFYLFSNWTFLLAGLLGNQGLRCISSVAKARGGKAVFDSAILTRKKVLPPVAHIEANAGRLEQKFDKSSAIKDWLLPLFSTKVDWPVSSSQPAERK